MADTEAKTESPVVSSPKVKKTSAVKSASGKKPHVKPNHPPTSEMVNIAIGTLKERGGSSLQAIKKYLAANYQTDSDKMAPFIKKYLKAAVANGTLIQVKGKGASGSFKLAAPAKKAKSDKKPADKVKKVKASSDKKKAPKSPKKKSSAVAKKSPTKKSTVEKKKAVVKQAVAAKKTGVVKAKAPKEKVTKTPIKTVAKKPKTVKPIKKVTAPSPKKVAAPAKKAAPKK